jgi:hypothetical protein
LIERKRKADLGKAEQCEPVVIDVAPHGMEAAVEPLVMPHRSRKSTAMTRSATVEES